MRQVLLHCSLQTAAALQRLHRIKLNFKLVCNSKRGTTSKTLKASASCEACTLLDDTSAEQHSGVFSRPGPADPVGPGSARSDASAAASLREDCQPSLTACAS